MRRTSRIIVALGVVLALTLVLISPAAARVWTDQADYTPGSVVTISGDNSDGAGYLPGETVQVVVSGPNGYTASCEATVDEAGAWQCQVTLPADESAVGSYEYRATGVTSGVSESGTFTDAISLKLLGADNNEHPNASKEENLGSFTQGTRISLTCPRGTGLTLVATGLGGGGVTWSLGYVAGYGDEATLRTVTTLNPSSGTLHGPGNDSACVAVTIATAELGAKTYHGQLKATAGGANAVYYFQFTVTDNADTTAPTTTITLNPGQPDGNSGWYRSNVYVTVSAADDAGGSGVAEVRCVLDPQTAPTSFDAMPTGCTYGGSGADVTTDGQHTLYAASKDTAGNKSAVASASFNIDKTAPTLTWGTATPAPNAAGWNNSDVSIAFTASDATSGVASTDPASPLVLTAEGSAVTGSVTVTDNAGNTATFTSPVVKIDKTRPRITASAKKADGTAYTADAWTNQAVTVHFACSDEGGSGVASCPADVTYNEEGTFSASGTVYDNAGNSASVSFSPINIDKTAPTFGECPECGDIILGSGTLTVAISADDALSGIDSDASTLTREIDASSVGSKTLTFTAFDIAGNSATKQCTYRVIFNWSGFFRPVDNPVVVNRVKAGSAIPIKFSLAGNQGLNIFATGYPASFAMTTFWGAPIEDIPLEETVFAGNSGLTYDPIADQYVYVWKTDKSWAGTSRELIVKLIDGTYHRAYFTFTK